MSLAHRVARSGDVPNVMVDGSVYVYYVGGDHVIGLATCGLNDLLDYALNG